MLFASVSVPSNEMAGLEYLYNSTNGDNWIWRGPVGQWNFTDGSNPCVIPWQGVTCSCVTQGFDDVCNVVELILEDYYLHGTLPEELSLLSSLQHFDVSSNLIRSTVPTSVGKMSSLTLLNINTNLISGTLPPEMETMSSLVYLNLEFTRTNGSIVPPFLCQMTQLTYISMKATFHTGTLPTCVGQFISLVKLKLEINSITGTVQCVYCWV